MQRERLTNTFFKMTNTQPYFAINIYMILHGWNLSRFLCQFWSLCQMLFLKMGLSFFLAGLDFYTKDSTILWFKMLYFQSSSLILRFQFCSLMLISIEMGSFKCLMVTIQTFQMIGFDMYPIYLSFH